MKKIMGLKRDRQGVPMVSTPSSGTAMPVSREGVLASWGRQLNGAQLLEVVQGVVAVAQAGFAYASERERTQQIQAQVTARLRELAVMEKQDYYRYQQTMEQLKNEAKKQAQQHEETLLGLRQCEQREANQQHNFERLLKRFDQGAISVDEFVQLWSMRPNQELV